MSSYFVVKFKKLVELARFPTQKVGDVGFDLYAHDLTVLPPRSTTKVGTGIAISDYNPNVYVDADINCAKRINMTVYPKIEGRSGLAANGVFPIGGIIDPAYRGEICVVLANIGDEEYIINTHARIAQLVFYTCIATPSLVIQESDVVSETERGSNGFGSSGA
jgi:deoxyuridine 5'-triphosphate nucleotidohydrolase